MFDPIAAIEAAKAKRRKAGLVSQYPNEDSSGTYEMCHPTAEHKAFWDRKYDLRAKYVPVNGHPTDAETAELQALDDAARKSLMQIATI